MKKLNKIQINTEKLLKNEELLTLRGGYGFVICYNGPTICAVSSNGFDCNTGFCDSYCEGWDVLVCY